MGIRIDPALEFVWRDPHTVQLGTDPVRAIIPVPTAAAERFLIALRTETAQGALPAIARQCGCEPDEAADILRESAPALRQSAADEPPTAVIVLGTNPLADAVAGNLHGEGFALERRSLDGPLPDETTLSARSPSDPGEPRHLVIVVAEHVIAPRLRAGLARRSVPHLPVVVGDGAVRVGPIVEPVGTPCLHCLELHRSDQDHAWPVVATQLLGRRAALLSPYRVAFISALTTQHVLRFFGSSQLERRAEQVVVDRASLSVVTQTVEPHPTCLCGGLPGIDSDDVPRSEPRRVATT